MPPLGPHKRGRGLEARKGGDGDHIEVGTVGGRGQCRRGQTAEQPTNSALLVLHPKLGLARPWTPP